MPKVAEDLCTLCGQGVKRTEKMTFVGDFCPYCCGFTFKPLELVVCHGCRVKVLNCGTCRRYDGKSRECRIRVPGVVGGVVLREATDWCAEDYRFLSDKVEGQWRRRRKELGLAEEMVCFRCVKAGEREEKKMEKEKVGEEENEGDE